MTLISLAFERAGMLIPPGVVIVLVEEKMINATFHTQFSL